MDKNAKNRDIAIARWARVRKKEEQRIRNNQEALRMKATICGFLAGDGNIQIRKGERNYQVRFYPDDKLMLEAYLKAISYVYGKQPSITIRDNVFNLCTTSRTMAEDLRNTAKSDCTNGTCHTYCSR